MTVLPIPKPASPLVRARFAIFAMLLGLVLGLAWVADRLDPVTPASAQGAATPSADREPANPAENR